MLKVTIIDNDGKSWKWNNVTRISVMDTKDGNGMFNSRFATIGYFDNAGGYHEETGDDYTDIKIEKDVMDTTLTPVIFSDHNTISDWLNTYVEQNKEYPSPSLWKTATNYYSKKKEIEKDADSTL